MGGGGLLPGGTVVNVRLNEHEVGAQAVGEFLGVPGDHGQLRSRSPCSSAPGAAVVSSRDEDAVAPPRRLDPLLYDQLRAIQQSFTKEMYDYAVAYLQRTLERTPTEGIGDCWLLTILAGFEIKHQDASATAVRSSARRTRPRAASPGGSSAERGHREGRRGPAGPGGAEEIGGGVLGLPATRGVRNPGVCTRPP